MKVNTNGCKFKLSIFKVGISLLTAILALLGTGAIAPVGEPFAGDDVHLEVGRFTHRAVEAVIAAGVVGAAVGFELIEVQKDVEGHGHLRPGARFGVHQPRRGMSRSVAAWYLEQLTTSFSSRCS